MKKIILTAAVLMCTASFAQSVEGEKEATSDMYAGFHIGPSQVFDISDHVRYRINGTELDGPIALTFSFNNGLDFGALLGYSFGDYRAEFEISRFSSSVDKIGMSLGQFRGLDELTEGRFSGFLFMANALYDFNMTDFTPYVGAGLGLAAMKLELNNEEQDPMFDKASAESKMAYQFLVGAKKSMGAFTFGGGLKYVNILENDYVVAEQDQGQMFFTDSVSMLSVTANLTYSF